MLEDNRDLLNDMTNRESSKEGAAQLPKLLFDLMSQANDTQSCSKGENTEMAAGCSQETETTQGNDGVKAKVTSAQEILHNLPKVWKVLIELLNHQKTKEVEFDVSLI